MATIADSGSVRSKAGTTGTTSAVWADSDKPKNKDRLVGDEILRVSQSLVSPNGQFSLVFQDDGNFVLYDQEKKPIWHANSHHSVGAESRVTMEGGNLRVMSRYSVAWSIERSSYDSDLYRRILRTSREGSLDKTKLLLVQQDDGDLVYSYDGQVTWASKTGRKVSPRLPTNGNRNRLYVGEALRMNDTLKSQNGEFELKMEGNLVLRWGSKEIWRQVDGPGSRPSKLELLANGDLVLPGAFDTVKWSSGSGGKGNAESYVELADDGDLSINSNGKPIWRSNTKQNLSNKSQPPPITNPGDPDRRGPPGPDRLRAGEKLFHGQSITSPNGRYKLSFQSDGNFVLYDGSNPTWATETTSGVTPTEVCMQEDDNLIVGGGGSRGWSSKTRSRLGGGSAVLFIQDSGSAIIKSEGKIVWSTNGGLVERLTPKLEAIHPDNLVMRNGQYLPVNQPLNSSNGQFAAVLQPDGNLIVRRNGTNITVWSANSGSNNTATQLGLGFDAQLAIYASNGSKIWTSKGQTMDGETATLTMQDDGKLALMRPYGDQPMWSNGITFPVSNAPTDTLSARQSLALDQTLTSGDCQFGFTKNCNLYIRDKQGKTTYFYTAPKDLDSAVRLTCRPDQEVGIEIFDSRNNSLWKSQNREFPRYQGEYSRGIENKFLLLSSGFAFVRVLGRDLWASDEQPSGSTPKPPPPKPGVPTLASGSSLFPGESLASPNGVYKLFFQSDGNFVLYANGRPEWASDTYGRSGTQVTMQSDGNLVMSDQYKRTLWCSNSANSYPGSKIVFKLQDDGAAIITVNDRSIWSSKTSRGRVM